MSALTEISFTKLVGAVAIVGTLLTGSYKTVDLISNDGNWKGVVSTKLEAIPEIKADLKDIKADIKELLQRIPRK
jgi:hypothetical protein